MSQPPKFHHSPPTEPPSTPPQTGNGGSSRPLWRLPAGVSPGTWEYVSADSIATGYQAFIAKTPLVAFDTAFLRQQLPPPTANRQTRVIDFGCGDGRTLRSLWADGYDVLGVDLSQPMLRQVAAGDFGDELARRRVRGNLVELGCLDDDIADHAVCLFSTIGMIRGRRCRRQFLSHVARIVRPGGKLLLHVHNRNAAWRDRPSSLAWCRSAVAACRYSDRELGDQTYRYRGLAEMFLHSFSLTELRGDLRDCRWRIQEIVPLASDGSGPLNRPGWLPGLRAGGFIAVATAQ